MSDDPPAHDDVHLLCHRCGADLSPGRFYYVRIEAFADPSLPPITRGELARRDLKRELSDLLEQMESIPATELMDGVYRRITLHLCGACYRQWIEDPTG